MATTDKKINITIRIADAPPMALSVSPEEEPQCREAEKLVNSLWNKWMRLFSSPNNSYEVLARVAFQFARRYAIEYQNNVAVNNLLAEFEKNLDEIVVKTD